MIWRWLADRLVPDRALRWGWLTTGDPIAPFPTLAEINAGTDLIGFLSPEEACTCNER